MAQGLSQGGSQRLPSHKELLTKDEQIADLRKELQSRQWRIRDLEMKLRATDAQTIGTAAVVRRHGPQAIETLVAAVAFVVVASWTVGTWLSEAVARVRTSLPFQGACADWAVGALFVCSAAWVLCRLTSRARVGRMVDRLARTESRQAFEKYLMQYQRLPEFSELDILSFVTAHFGTGETGRAWALRLWDRFVGNRTGSRRILEELKEYFLLTLLYRDLVEDARKPGLCRSYRLSQW